MAYKHAWILYDVEVRKRLERVNPRLDQNYLRKLQADPVFHSFSLSIKKLLAAAESLRREDESFNTLNPIFSSMDIEEIMDPIIFRTTAETRILDIYNYYDPDNIDKNLRYILIVYTEIK